MSRITRCACRTFVVVALVLGAATAAMAQGGDVSVAELLVGDNMRLTPSVINARPGERLRVVLRGAGKIQALAHNFVLLKSGVVPKAFVDKASEATKATGSIPPAMKEQVVVASALVKSGETAEVTFEAPSQPGEYTFICTFPGHFNLGMKGQLLVR